MFDKKQLKGARQRLRKGQLSADDLKLLEELLDGAEEVASLGKARTAGGKRILAHLPFGMDVVK